MEWKTFKRLYCYINIFATQYAQLQGPCLTQDQVFPGPYMNIDRLPGVKTSPRITQFSQEHPDSYTDINRLSSFEVPQKKRNYQVNPDSNTKSDKRKLQVTQREHEYPNSYTDIDRLSSFEVSQRKRSNQVNPDSNTKSDTRKSQVTQREHKYPNSYTDIDRLSSFEISQGTLRNQMYPDPYTEINGQPSVRVSQGIILGIYRKTQENTSYVSFEGIPYAKPPVGTLRFRDPLPADKRTRILNATRPRSPCPQIVSGLLVGSEDCLFINVYAPVNTNNANLPVLVYIHGGAFLKGSATGDNIQNYFINKGILVITISYRLGALGFLCLNTKDVPGNAGMKDQVLALEWVKNNVKHFSGDTENISLMGSSAGAVSVELHRISPMSRGLFHKLIPISGAALCGWAIQNTPLEKASAFGALLGLNSTSPDFLNELQHLDINIIKIAMSLTPIALNGNMEDLFFSPVVEQRFAGVEPFLLRDPIRYYNPWDFSHVPTLIGYSSKEYTEYFKKNYPIPMDKIITMPAVVVPDKWHRSLGTDGILRVYKVILEFFFKGQKNITFSSTDIVESAIDLMSDKFVVKPIQDAVNLMANINKKPVYFYRFSFKGTVNAFLMDEVGIQGASHADVKKFLCQNETARVNLDSPGGFMVRRLVEMFSNFVIFGDPTPGPYSDLLPTVWKPVSPKRMHYMEINGENTPSVNPDEYRMKFWNKLERKVYAGLYNK